jgi:hypothetical protein
MILLSSLLMLTTFMILPTTKGILLTLYLIATDDSMSDSSSDPVTILSVSTRLGKENTTPIGSLEGGNVIFMKVSHVIYY